MLTRYTNDDRNTADKFARADAIAAVRAAYAAGAAVAETISDAAIACALLDDAADRFAHDMAYRIGAAHRFRAAVPDNLRKMLAVAFLRGCEVRYFSRPGMRGFLAPRRAK